MKLLNRLKLLKLHNWSRLQKLPYWLNVTQLQVKRDMVKYGPSWALKLKLLNLLKYLNGLKLLKRLKLLELLNWVMWVVGGWVG